MLYDPLKLKKNTTGKNGKYWALEWSSPVITIITFYNTVL